jgi:hypothetical protein
MVGSPLLGVSRQEEAETGTVVVIATEAGWTVLRAYIDWGEVELEECEKTALGDFFSEAPLQQAGVLSEKGAKEWRAAREEARRRKCEAARKLQERREKEAYERLKAKFGEED